MSAGDDIFVPYFPDLPLVLDGETGNDIVDYILMDFAVNVNLLEGVTIRQNGVIDTLISIENVSGSNFNDIITGDNNANKLSGGIFGNDFLNGMSGDDILIGERYGSDTLNGGEGIDTVDYRNSFGVTVNLLKNNSSKFGGSTDTLISIENILGSNSGDTITGNDNQNHLYGLDGFYDILDGAGGDDILEGGNGTDYLYGGLGNDQLFGGSDNDYIFGDGGTDTLYGGSGDDFLRGNYYSLEDGKNDFLYGEDGNDYLVSGKGADLLNGGEGIDTVIYEESLSAISINLATSSYSGGSATGDTLISIENIYGSNYNDTLLGDANANVINGSFGNDTIKGRDGDDYLFGDNGSDYLEGGNGNDLLSGGEGADTLKGSAGIDTFVYTNTTDAGDIIQDFNVKVGEKLDVTLVLNNAINFTLDKAFTAGYISTAQNGANTDVFIDMDGYLSGYNKTLLATLLNVAATTITPNAFILPNTAPIAADDTFYSIQDHQVTGNVLANNGGGVDSDPEGNNLYVSTGNISPKHGTVEIHTDGSFTYTPTTGYFGFDSFTYKLSDDSLSDEGSVIFRITQSPFGTEGNDHIAGTTGHDQIYGYGGDDYLYGDVGNDTLYGGNGNDTLKGGDGNDIIYGGSGADIIEGNNGDDILYGGAGNDILKGGAGVDTYVFTSLDGSIDTVRDYHYNNGDKVDISALLDLYDPLTHAISDFVKITQVGLDCTIAVDIDGGADNFVTLVTLLNPRVDLTDEQALVNSGHLLV